MLSWLISFCTTAWRTKRPKVTLPWFRIIELGVYGINQALLWWCTFTSTLYHRGVSTRLVICWIWRYIGRWVVANSFMRGNELLTICFVMHFALTGDGMISITVGPVSCVAASNSKSFSLRIFCNSCYWFTTDVRVWSIWLSATTYAMFQVIPLCFG